MIIKRIYVKSFGNLRDFEILPEKHLNVIYGENESGKSTLAAFIKFIFYGFTSKRGRDSSFSESERYINWDSHEASGTVELTTDAGLSYRIEREVYKSGKKSVSSLKVIDLQDGSLINDDPEDLFLDGAPEDVYLKTLFISQKAGNYLDTKSVQASVENMLSGGDENANTKKALSKLDSARIVLLYKNEKGGRIFNLRQEIKRETERRFSVSSDNQRIKLLKEEISALEQEEKEIKSSIKQTDDKEDHIEALQRLERINATKTAKAKIDELEKEQAEFISSIEHNGFVPDKSYKKALDERLGRYYLHLEELQRFVEKRDLIKEKYENAINKDRGRDVPLDAVSKSVSTADKKRVKLKALSTYFLIGSTALALVFVLSLFLFSGISLFLGIMTVVAVSFFGAMKYLMKARENEIRSLLISVGADSVEELKYFRDTQGRLSEKRDLIAKEMADAEHALKNKKEELSLMISEFSSLSQKYGVVCENAEDCKTFAENVAQKVKRSEEFSELIARKKEELRLGCEDFTEAEFENLKKKASLVREDITEDPRTLLLGLKSKRKELEGRYNDLRSAITDKKMMLSSMLAGFEDEATIGKRISKLALEMERLEFIHGALMLAEDALEKASTASRDRIAPTLSKLSSQFIEQTTGGKYQKINVDSSLKLSYTHDETTRELDYLSEGTQDVVYLAFRLSLVSMLFSDPPPIVIDEGLAGMDDNRLESTLRAIDQHARKMNAQVFIFSPTKRESSALYKINGTKPITL